MAAVLWVSSPFAVKNFFLFYFQRIFEKEVRKTGDVWAAKEKWTL